MLNSDFRAEFDSRSRLLASRGPEKGQDEMEARAASGVWLAAMESFIREILGMLCTNVPL